MKVNWRWRLNSDWLWKPLFGPYVVAHLVLVSVLCSIQLIVFWLVTR